MWRIIDFEEKPEGKRELFRPRHRWVDNITQALKESGRTNVLLIHLDKETDKYGLL